MPKTIAPVTEFVANTCRCAVTIFAILGPLAATPGCEDAPAEPVGSNPSPRDDSAASGLSWQAPPSWRLEKSAKSGQFRAKYQVPKQGAAKHDAEMLVKRLGTGTKAKLDEEVKSFLGDFEGSGTAEVTREPMTVGDIEVELVSLDATYKFPMGPRVKGRPAATMVKEDWSGLAAAVRSPKHGNWFFSVVGPEETVHGARGDFREMIASLE